MAWNPLPDRGRFKELLRHLLAKIDGGARPYEIRERLDVFYSHAAHADIPELTRLATTIDTWWPAVEAFLRLRVTNARTEGYNTNIKLIKRTARGFRSQGQLPASYPARQRGNRRVTNHPRTTKFTLHREEPVTVAQEHGDVCRAIDGDLSLRGMTDTVCRAVGSMSGHPGG